MVLRRRRDTDRELSTARTPLLRKERPQGRYYGIPCDAEPVYAGWWRWPRAKLAGPGFTDDMSWSSLDTDIEAVCLYCCLCSCGFKKKEKNPLKHKLCWLNIVWKVYFCGTFYCHWCSYFIRLVRRSLFVNQAMESRVACVFWWERALGLRTLCYVEHFVLSFSKWMCYVFILHSHLCRLLGVSALVISYWLYKDIFYAFDCGT